MFTQIPKRADHWEKVDGSPEVDFRFNIPASVVQSMSGRYSPGHIVGLHLGGLDEHLCSFVVPRTGR
jgi:hypothetical protein